MVFRHKLSVNAAIFTTIFPVFFFRTTNLLKVILLLLPEQFYKFLSSEEGILFSL